MTQVQRRKKDTGTGKNTGHRYMLEHRTKVQGGIQHTGTGKNTGTKIQGRNIGHR